MNRLNIQELQNSSFLSGLPRWDWVNYQGEAGLKIQSFLAVQGQEQFQLFVATVIRKEEGFLWKSFLELLERTLKACSAGIRGFFGFDLLGLQIYEGLQNFQWGNFQQLVANHARKLQVGEALPIAYTSLLGLLTKRVDETWGKIECRTFVEVCSEAPQKPDLLLRKLAKAGGDKSKTFFALVLDLSQTPIFNFEDEIQKERLVRFLEKQKGPSGDLRPYFYVKDRNGTVELGARLGLRQGSHV